jgi:PAT family beta-lactamase induction signal transducer AmpG
LVAPRSRGGAARIAGRADNGDRFVPPRFVPPVVRFPVPDLLATRAGRLTAFFLLYVTEGIPLGFTATAIATQMRRQGLGPAAIGVFVGSLYLPWAFKWLAGPFVDTFSSDRCGRRRLWIILMQVGMMAMLAVAMPLDFVTQVGLFTAVIFLHNAFGATQDVAIDALAVTVLPEHERGVANGYMFAGASIGQAIGGSGVLFLAAVLPFATTYAFVIGAILCVTVFVVLPLKEPPGPPRPASDLRPLAAALRDLSAFVRDAWRAFTGSRPARVGVLVALLPAGAYALSLALQSNLAVELGLTDSQIAQLNLVSTVIFALACVAGGWLSDRFGRRRMLALFVFLTVVPTLWLAWHMQAAGWIMPVDVTAAGRPQPSPRLVTVFWAAVLAFNVFQGLYYGVRSALFMDVTTRAVAATQFTAYMALSNLAITYTSWWQGLAIVRWGYPVTLAIDAAAGLVMIAFLPLMRARREAVSVPAPRLD